jgi:3-methyladenine DNA glycosylase/8-oxoguanine DNA glycosylase
VDDLGLREGVRAFYHLPERPSADQVIKLAEPWRPYRSIATWYVWRGLAGAAQSQTSKDLRVSTKPEARNPKHEVRNNP